MISAKKAIKAVEINVFEQKSKENTVKTMVFQHFETKSYKTQ
jgi:hypothetical protein